MTDGDTWKVRVCVCLGGVCVYAESDKVKKTFSCIE